MDVLKPELLWVEGRCYRNFEESAWSNNRVDKFYTENNEEMEDYYEDLDDEIDIEIEEYENHKFRHSFHVPKELFRFIIGAKNATRRRIENDTRTKINIPKMGQDGDIVIVGGSKNGIISARKRIDFITLSSKKKLQFTHFLSIPLNTDEIIKNYEKFKQNVLSEFGNTSRGVEEDIFQNPNKLHMTLILFTLLDDEERNEAIKTFNDCADDFMRPFLEKHGPINVKLKGVECMNDDPSSVSVLYAKIDTKDTILQQFVNNIMEYFFNQGLIEKQQDSVKMHMTLMNTKFLLKDENYKGPRKTFDATQIISAHKDTVFGEIKLSEIHLSQRHTFDDKGYYKSSAMINFS